MRRLTTLALSLALLAAACSEDPGPDAAADASAEVMAMVEEALGSQVPVDPDEIVVPEGCRIVIEVDEYGFETEILVCDEDPATTTTTIATTGMTGWLESPDARAVANALVNVVLMQEGCTDTRPIDRLADLLDSAPPLIGSSLEEALPDLYRMAAACDDPNEWQAALEAALDHLEAASAILKGDPNA